jgi:hypothetical protein
MSARPGRASTSSGYMTPIQCRWILDITEKIARLPIARSFAEPVNPAEIPQYSQTIKHPMWLQLVLERIRGGQYQTVEQWKQEMNLIWRNAKLFNTDDTIYYRMADELEAIFRRKAEHIPRTETEEWVLKLRKAQSRLADLVK